MPEPPIEVQDIHAPFREALLSASVKDLLHLSTRAINYANIMQTDFSKPAPRNSTGEVAPNSTISYTILLA